MLKLIVSIWLFLMITDTSSQITNDTISRILNGLIVDHLTCKPIENVLVRNKKTSKAVFSDSVGGFSIIAKEGDTITFHFISYKKYILITGSKDFKNLIVKMNAGNIFLKPKIVYPWPSKERFRDEFIKLDTMWLDKKIKKTSLNQKKLELASVSPGFTASQGYRWTMMRIMYAR